MIPREWQGLEGLPIPLLAWYAEAKRDLPWRRTREPYPIWVSEIMLQQTRVAAVLGYYPRFLEAFPTVEALAAADGDRLMKCWQGLGYYSRARSLQRAAQIIVTQHKGVFPSTYEAIRALPGVGDYTAGAIASQAFSLPTPAVDGNVLRVAARIAGSDASIDLPATRRAVTSALAALIPLRDPGTFNQAMMELGATVCLPHGAPLCSRCPARDFCAARLQGRTGALPVRSPKRPRRVEERAVYLYFHGGRVALRRRPETGLLAGLWEFPNTLAGDPSPLPVGEPSFAGAARHIFTHIQWHMTAYTSPLPTPHLPPGWVWATAEELRDTYSVPSAFSPFLDTVFQRLDKKGEKTDG